MDRCNSDEELVSEARRVLGSDFHPDSFFYWMLVVKRMFFVNLFARRERPIPQEDADFDPEHFRLEPHKTFEFRSLLVVTKSLILFFNKIKELANLLETLKVFYSFDSVERELKLIFKNLERFFKIAEEESRRPKPV